MCAPLLQTSENHWSAPSQDVLSNFHLYFLEFSKSIYLKSFGLSLGWTKLTQLKEASVAPVPYSHAKSGWWAWDACYRGPPWHDMVVELMQSQGVPGCPDYTSQGQAIPNIILLYFIIHTVFYALVSASLGSFTWQLSPYHEDKPGQRAK